MFNMLIGLVVIVMWTIALIFLVLTLFFIKMKIGRLIFGTLTIVFATTPFLLFWGFEKSRLNQQERFIGQFSNYSTGNFLDLNEDLTWKSDSILFDCTQGTWEYLVTEDMNYLELKGQCDKTHTFLQIYSCTPNSLKFSPDQNTGRTEPIIELKRK